MFHKERMRGPDSPAASIDRIKRSRKGDKVKLACNNNGPRERTRDDSCDPFAWAAKQRFLRQNSRCGRCEDSSP